MTRYEEIQKEMKRLQQSFKLAYENGTLDMEVVENGYIYENMNALTQPNIFEETVYKHIEQISKTIFRLAPPYRQHRPKPRQEVSLTKEQADIAVEFCNKMVALYNEYFIKGQASKTKEEVAEENKKEENK